MSDAELSGTHDSSIAELIIGGESRYFRMTEILSSIQCVWFPDATFSNNCTWIVEGSRVGIRAAISLVNCQECFLPFGWTYGPTRNKSSSVCYQIWQGHYATILGTCSPFHHRLAWLLTKEFLDPSPRRLMRTSWRLQSDPPGEALVSVFSYVRWMDSLQSSFLPGYRMSMEIERVSDRFVMSDPLPNEDVEGQLDSSAKEN